MVARDPVVGVVVCGNVRDQRSDIHDQIVVVGRGIILRCCRNGEGRCSERC